jgi:hypothetical protein
LTTSNAKVDVDANVQKLGLLTSLRQRWAATIAAIRNREIAAFDVEEVLESVMMRYIGCR